ncbi:MAG: NAD-dependent epimerase/dehydratase family protein [Clostridia bacterium]|nr:NAD-dependent epimerase/dehydratase family protein [Clostridia bacterium]
MKRVLVTGGTGFLGYHLVKKLKAQGYDVYALGRNPDKGELLRKQGINFVRLSLQDADGLSRCCKGMDFVIHCGALSSPWGRYKDFYESNVTGTKNMVDACIKNNVGRLVHVSTPSIYFCYDSRLDVKENDPVPLKMVNHYAHTKYLAEKEVDKAFSKGLPVITVRPRAIFGEGDNAIIPRLIKANEKRGVPLIHRGAVLTDVTYVENVADALVLCLNADKSCLGEKYNITNGEPMPLIHILEMLFHALACPMREIRVPYRAVFYMAGLMELVHRYILTGREPLLTRYSVSVLAKDQTLNIEKAKRDLGYSPSISVKEGIQRFAKWYGEHEEGK